MMTKDFEKYFPLPMTFDEKNSVIEASNGITLAYTSKYLVQGRQARNALKRTWRYAVQCSNLMPEAVAIIKDLCDAAMAADSSIRGLEMTEKVIQRAEALLAKLEGGAGE